MRWTPLATPPRPSPRATRSVLPVWVLWCCSLHTQDLAFFAANPEQYPYFAGVVVDFALSNPYVVVGLIFGGLLPFLFGAMSDDGCRPRCRLRG